MQVHDLPPSWSKTLGTVLCVLSPLLLCCSFDAHAQAEQAPCPKLVRVGLLETFTPPFLAPPFQLGSEPSGLVADWVKAGAGQTHCKPEVVLRALPRKRAFWALEHGDLDFFLPVVPTVTSLEQFMFPMKNGKPNGDWAFKIEFASLWVRQDETEVEWDGHTLKGPPRLVVGVTAGSPAEVLAKKQGWHTSVGNSPSNTVDRLVHGHVRVILVADIVVASFPPEVVAGLKRLTPPLARYEYQAAGSKAFVASYPAFADEFWLSLCQAGKAYAMKLPQTPSGEATSCH